LLDLVSTAGLHIRLRRNSGLCLAYNSRPLWSDLFWSDLLGTIFGTETSKQRPAHLPLVKWKQRHDSARAIWSQTSLKEFGCNLPRILPASFDHQTLCSLVGFSQPKLVSQQCFALTINQHQPAQTSSETNQRTGSDSRILSLIECAHGPRTNVPGDLHATQQHILGDVASQIWGSEV